MRTAAPILLSFYGLSNGQTTAFFGKLAYANETDLSFQNYSRLKTFRSILALYHTRPVRNKSFIMQFDEGTVSGQTDRSGSFWCEVQSDSKLTRLIAMTLVSGSRNVVLTKDLYPNTIQNVTQQTILISDLDDTLIDSFISSKLRQLKTLLFTTVEKRKAVEKTAAFVKQLAQTNVATFYLSNSEQNLYPMLYRFMALNQFPAGPLLLRQYVHVRHWAWRKITGKANVHKRTMLEKIVELFPDKQYLLLGDNTQHDLSIYLDFAKDHPALVRSVIIRQASSRSQDKKLMAEASDFFNAQKIGFYYGTELPTSSSVGHDI